MSVRNSNRIPMRQWRLRDRAVFIGCIAFAVACAALLVTSLVLQEHLWYLHVITFAASGATGVFTALTVRFTVLTVGERRVR